MSVLRRHEAACSKGILVCYDIHPMRKMLDIHTGLGLVGRHSYIGYIYKVEMPKMIALSQPPYYHVSCLLDGRQGHLHTQISITGGPMNGCSLLASLAHVGPMQAHFT